MPMGGHIPSQKLSIYSSYMRNMLQNIFKHSVNLSLLTRKSRLHQPCRQMTWHCTAQVAASGKKAGDTRSGLRQAETDDHQQADGVLRQGSA